MADVAPDSGETDTEAYTRRRLDSALEAEGAEFLVLGNLLLNHVVANKAYSNTKDYDIIAVNPDTKVAVTVQVKSRWRTGANNFMLSAVRADFVVLVSLNRGRDAKGQGGDPADPSFMILPRDVAEAALAANRHGKIPLNKLPVSNAAGAPYLGGWKLIADALGVDFKPFG
jgi:hypothetical protein